jgi:hypothetical protein
MFAVTIKTLIVRRDSFFGSSQAHFKCVDAFGRLGKAARRSEATYALADVCPHGAPCSAAELRIVCKCDGRLPFVEDVDKSVEAGLLLREIRRRGYSRRDFRQISNFPVR